MISEFCVCYLPLLYLGQGVTDRVLRGVRNLHVYYAGDRLFAMAYSRLTGHPTGVDETQLTEQLLF